MKKYCNIKNGKIYTEDELRKLYKKGLDYGVIVPYKYFMENYKQIDNNITFKSENVDGKIIDWEFDSIAAILKDWWNDDGTNLPSGDDRIYEYNIDGNTIKCDILFDTLIEELELQYWNDLEL